MAAPDAPSAYLQLCDTSVADIAAEDLADEARHHREIPGTGLLPLAALLAAVPEDTAVAVEVQSDSLLDRMGPQAMAAACRSAIGRLLS